MAIRQRDLKNSDPNNLGGVQAEPHEFVPEQGKSYTLRFLPSNIDEYEADLAKDFAFFYLFHYKYTKRDGSVLENTTCPKTTSMQNFCQMCDDGWALFNSTNPQDKALSKTMLPKTRAVLNLIDITTAESVAKGVQFWKAPIQKVYDEIKKFILNPSWCTDGQDLLHLEKGKNFVMRYVSKKETGTGYANYEISPLPQPFDIRPYLNPLPTWREEINALKGRVPHILTSAEMKALIADGVPVNTPAPAAPAPAAPAPAAPAPAAPAPAAPASTAPASTIPGELAECFGVALQTREAKCKACPQLLPCKKKFLEN